MCVKEHYFCLRLSEGSCAEDGIPVRTWKQNKMLETWERCEGMHIPGRRTSMGKGQNHAGTFWEEWVALMCVQGNGLGSWLAGERQLNCEGWVSPSSNEEPLQNFKQGSD